MNIVVNSMGLSAPWDDSLEIIVINPVKTLLGINPMGLSDPRAKYLDIVAFQIVIY